MVALPTSTSTTSRARSHVERARLLVRGAVQGVGFRPFVFRLANELSLAGWVSNSEEGVVIEVEGAAARLEAFLKRLQTDKPPLAAIHELQRSYLPAAHHDHFEIRGSQSGRAPTAFVLPDLATCADCLRELFDPKDRRYLYPFTNCTHCGPRFSIIERLPYDRANTSMKKFVMCAECEREYHDPANRRFHAQPNACPKCGPRLELWDNDGRKLLAGHEALVHAAAAVRRGQILALKGIGGFQLIADARNDEAIQRLRARKRREEKPFAVMFPSVGAIEACCPVGPLEKELLRSAAAPIVLVRKFATDAEPSERIAPSVAPGNPFLGAMVPYSPLHHLVLGHLNFPVVATSGNASEEPICTDEHEALNRLRDIADLFLVHNRPIVRHVDDSVVRVMLGREMMLRRARGYAPLPIDISFVTIGSTQSEKSHPGENRLLSLGAHLKNSVALCLGNQAFVSQHIGDLQTPHGVAAFKQSAADLPQLYQTSPAIVAHDLHPDYVSTRLAHQLAEANDNGAAGPRCIAVQHHYAHILSCMADNELTGTALGVAWDGTGFGTDGTIWGGEFLLINETSFERFAHFRQFRLPGGDTAIKQPRRAAIGLFYEIFGPEVFDRTDLLPLQHFSQNELRMLARMLESAINSPLTSSAGRFFDAIASLLGLRQHSNFEGQAAMELEFASSASIEDVYAFEVSRATPHVFDWQPTITQMLNDLGRNQPLGFIAAKVHNTLAEAITAVARTAGETNVILSGGCFQNQYLTERVVRRLREDGFLACFHRRVPPNDGGIALGQIAAAIRAGHDLGNERAPRPRHPAALEYLNGRTG